MMNRNLHDGSLDCKLCIDKIRAKCIEAKKIKVDHLCAKQISTSEELCMPSVNSPVICTDQLRATDICTRGVIKATELQQCGKYRATATFSANSTYTLGTNINFDVATDDPNGNLTFAPTVYTVPLSGYYIVTVQFDQQNLQGTIALAGIPIANLEILVNGVAFRENFTPYLSFHNEQKSTLSSLISLKAGDKVGSRYNVFVMTDLSGFSPYVGTVNSLGNGSEANGSMFKIHYLSSDCTEAGMPCEPCGPCEPGMGCELPCSDCVSCRSNF